MILESLGLRALEIPTCMEESLRTEDLKKALDRFPVRACLLTPNFNNPVGTLYPDEKKEEIVKLLAARKIPLIEDDVYGDLYFGDTRPLTCKHFDKSGQVLFCSSFSKTLSPGLRVGWLEPGAYFEEALKHKLATSLSSPGINQLVVADFLKTGHYDRHLRKLREILRVQHGRYRALVAKLFPEGTCVTQPQGGTVLWIELPKDRDGDRIYQAAQKEGILLMPGSVFGAQDRFRHCIRLNYGRPLDHKTEKALTRLAEIVG
jgi:DNA-binding transcriptional MocR family regulator